MDKEVKPDNFFKKVIRFFGHQSAEVINLKSYDEIHNIYKESGFEIRPGEYYYKFIKSATFAEAIELQKEIGRELAPQIKAQIIKHGHTTGEVFEDAWQLWHCNEILKTAITEEKGIQERLKAEILKRTNEVSNAFSNFNHKVGFDNVNNGQAGRRRAQLANEFVIALTALKLVNTRELVDCPVDLSEHITGEQATYVKRDKRSS